ncbi:hypothetical protein HNY73_003370 [Argiope bruennichi]|uniref:Uncharacterized protein n=1 Tax=Argiope bruennichi TaxID=94029 RepID=A0A8T0FMS5_ARGBR|nr:hypothetical protein HNY73_003370 [Argiope bruennichi]
MQDYCNVKEVLLDGFKMKPETFRSKFIQHQKKTGALWKGLVSELWVEPLERGRPASLKKEIKNKPVEKSEPQFWKKSTPKGNWRENFERRTVPACYICHSMEHLKPNCPQLRKSGPNLFINRIEATEYAEVLFASYMSKALVNNVEMPILRDTSATIDLACRNDVRSEILQEEPSG